VAETKNSEYFLSRIVDVQARTLQEFLDELADVYNDFGVNSASLFSRLILREDVLELIASTADDQVTSVAFDTESRTAKVFLELGSFYLSINCKTQIPTPSVLRKALANKLEEVLYQKKQSIRRAVIEQSIKSKDVNSFLHRLVRALSSEFINAGDISIFLNETTAKKLFLSASTSHVRGMEKKDIYYNTRESSPSVDSFNSNLFSVEDHSTHIVAEEFDPNIFNAKLYNRGFWPISLVQSSFSSIKAEEIAPLGVIRICNLQRRRDAKSWVGSFSRYDETIISFICEVTFVLIQQYIQFMSSDHDFARLTHGLGANIDASVKFAINVRDTLFDTDEAGNIKANFALHRQSIYRIEDIFLELKNLEYFLEDLGYQFEKGQTASAANYEKEIIDKPYADILMPSVRLAAAIAAANSKKPPRMTNLKAAGAQDLPPILGNRKGLILVLRNLYENSIKYTKEKIAKIDLSFKEDEKFIVLDYYDDGIGIPDSELEQVFVEGYRLAAGRRISNRGIGIGLSSSREMMRHLSGDLECIAREKGAHFRLKIRKA
jgi:hypothetical protein